MPGIVRVARIRLARAPLALLVQPFAAVLAGALAIVAGTLLVHETPGMVLAGVGAFVIALGLVLAWYLLTIRLDITHEGILVSSLFGTRHHVLARGPVTRLTLRGPDAVPLRAAVGGGAWAVGRARLRERERIWMVRLARVDALVVVPTDLGRLAIAPRSERVLLEGLAEIGRVKERLAEVTGDADIPADAVGVTPAAPESAVETPPAPPPVLPPVPRLLTGIERSIVWDLLDAAKVDEEAARRRADAERASADAGAAEPAAPPEEAPTPVASTPTEPRRWWRMSRRTPSPPAKAQVVAEAPAVASAAIEPAVQPGEVELHAPPVAEVPERRTTPAPVASASAAVAAEEPIAAAVEQPTGKAARRRRLTGRLQRLVSMPPGVRLVGIGLIAAPVALTVGAWYAADLLGTLPSSVEGRRSVALAFLLVGPGTALAGVIARAASPRIVGLVLLSAAVALLIAGRALLP